MRKLGIVIAITAAATLGFTGHASAQSQEDFCDGVIGAIAEGGADSPINDTLAGAQKSCNQSTPPPELHVVADPLLCGLEKDVGEVLDPALGEAVGSVHGGLDEIETQAEAGGFPDIVDFDHPCVTEGGGGGGNGGGGGGNGGGGGGAPAVQAANAAPDGGLPRTGGELFAGAGFALMSLGALVRRFLP